MRRFLTVALEEYKDTPPLGDENISMEEEAIMLDESSQCAAEANQDLNEAERIVQVSDALEDLAVVAGSKEDLTDHEAQLMESAGDMAVAGTDVSPEEIVPAMEAFRDAATGKISGKLAMENFREKADRLWQNIKKILKEIWEKITAFFYKIFGTIPRRRKALKALEAKVESTNSMTRDQAKFTVGGSRFMFTSNTAVKTAGAYESALKEFVATADWVYGSYVTYLKSTAEDVAKALNDFDTAEPQKATEALAKTLTTGGLSAKPPGYKAGGSAQRWTNYNVSKGHDLLGGVSLFHLIAKGSEGTGALATLDHARQATFTLDRSNDKDSGKNESIEFQTFSQAESIAAIKQLDKLLDTMEGYQRGKSKAAIADGKKKIEDASAKADKASESKRGSSDAADTAAMPHFRALVNFNVAFARWVESPTIQFTKLAFGVINQTEVLISRSCAQYK